MRSLSITEADNAVSALFALRQVLHRHITHIEASLNEPTCASLFATQADQQKLNDYKASRTTLLSGLESINEVLMWIRLLAARDPEDNLVDTVQNLVNAFMGD